MMPAFVVALLVSMASMASGLRPAATQGRSVVKMIYGARNPTGPFAGAPAQVQWRIEAASENVAAMPQTGQFPALPKFIELLTSHYKNP